MLEVVYARLPDMDKRGDIAEIIQNSSQEKLEKMSEVLGVSAMTLQSWGNAPEQVSDDDAELLTAVDDAWPDDEA